MGIPHNLGHRIAQLDSDALGNHMVANQQAHIGPQRLGQQLVGHLHEGGVDLPHIGQGFGHLQSDGAPADDNGLAHAALGDFLLDVNGVLQIGDRADAGQVGPRDRRHHRCGTGGQHQFVIGHIRRPAAVEVAYGELFGFAVDMDRFGGGLDGDAFGFSEEDVIPHRMGTGRAEPFDIGHVPADKIGNAASPIGIAIFFLDHGDFGGGDQPLDPAGHLGTQCDRADD